MTGTQLKNRRLELGLSQEKFARALDVSTASVARWEQYKDQEIVATGMLDLAVETLERRVAEQKKK